jgi:hypothetical protein
MIKVICKNIIFPKVKQEYFVNDFKKIKKGYNYLELYPFSMPNSSILRSF